MFRLLVSIAARPGVCQFWRDGPGRSHRCAGAAAIPRARGLIPLLRAAADRIEAANELPPDVLDAMFDAGMFKLLLPLAFGGHEPEPVD